MNGCKAKRHSQTYLRLLSTLVLLPLLALETANAEIPNTETRWNVVPGRSSIEFSVKHFLLMNVEGRFKRYRGSVTVSDPEDFTNAKVEATIPVKSIYTGNKDRDNHLLQKDFFYSEKYPDMKFHSTSVKKIGEDKYQMDGMISIRGVSQPISFIVTRCKERLLKNGEKCFTFKAKANLNRYDFGLRWNELTEAGGFTVGENVQIVMNIALAKMAAKKA